MAGGELEKLSIIWVKLWRMVWFGEPCDGRITGIVLWRLLVIEILVKVKCVHKLFTTFCEKQVSPYGGEAVDA
jgi:hypothetical protein